jgi:exodeoxyribonuclease V
MELTPKQTQVLYQIVTDVRGGKPQVKMGGYAGTGKSVLASYLAKFFPRFGICAFTGKAANVLRKKGMGTARTIHSLIYRPIMEDGQLVGFDLATPEELDCDGFIIDEGSMVGEDIHEDLQSYELPMIIIGDHGQLEPIGNSFNLMENPDYVLEEIHRNAGKIARFAEHLRFGKKATNFPECNEVQFKNQRMITSEDFLKVDQVICAFNTTRVETNNIIREAYGYQGLINVGERVMCLKNNRTNGLFNGMQGIVRNLYEDGRTGRKYMDFESNDTVIENIWYDTRYFGKEKVSVEYFGGGAAENPNPFDYSYCVTAHKAQGDEWNTVMVLEQKCRKWNNDRWNYTAGSRAKHGLVWGY